MATTVIDYRNDRRRAAAIAAFIEARDWEEAVIRAAEIACLPVVWFKGQPLRQVVCRGTTGKGNHVLNVPEWMLWVRIAVAPWYCPYHPKEAEPE